MTKAIKVPAINQTLKVEIMQKAIILYTEALHNSGIGKQAINVCLSAGMDFLRYYDIARRQMSVKKKTRK